MQIPLFPLHTVLAPGIALPLHIFEDRYRVLVRKCLDTSTPFGIVLIREGSETAPRDGTTAELAIAGVGTLAEIREASKFSDGRWNILVVGRSRFVIHEVLADVAPYLVAEADLLPDETGDEEGVDLLAGVVTRRFVEYLRLLQPRDGEQVEPIDVQLEVEVDDESDDDEPDGTGRTGSRIEAASMAPDDEAGEVLAAFGEDEIDADVLDVFDAAARGLRIERDATPPAADDRAAARSGLRIPDDPSTLSFLLTGIIQVDTDRKQALLEAATAEERLRDLGDLLEREIELLGLRLAPYALDRRELAGSAN